MHACTCLSTTSNPRVPHSVLNTRIRSGTVPAPWSVTSPLDDHLPTSSQHSSGTAAAATCNSTHPAWWPTMQDVLNCRLLLLLLLLLYQSCVGLRACCSTISAHSCMMLQYNQCPSGLLQPRNQSSTTLLFVACQTSCSPAPAVITHVIPCQYPSNSSLPSVHQQRQTHPATPYTIMQLSPHTQPIKDKPYSCITAAMISHVTALVRHIHSITFHSVCLLCMLSLTPPRVATRGSEQTL
jgi:hypothetical protein